MKKLLYILLCGLSIACSTKNGSEETNEASKDAMMDEVMQLHDEAMIPWGEIHDLNKQLATKIDALDSAQSSPEASQKYQQTAQALEEADDAMMGWMRDFHPDELQKMSPDSAITILQQKKASMEMVYNQVFSSVDSAKALLKQE